MTSPREKELREALRRLIPKVPAWDASEIIGHARDSAALSRARPEEAVWLSAVAFVRHTYTDYDALLADGYGVEAARHFVLEAMNEVLAEWDSRRMVQGDEDDA